MNDGMNMWNILVWRCMLRWLHILQSSGIKYNVGSDGDEAGQINQDRFTKLFTLSYCWQGATEACNEVLEGWFYKVRNW